MGAERGPMPERSPSASAAKERAPAYHGKEKLEALAEKVWAKGDIDDMDARSILAYIAQLERQAARGR